MAQLKSDPHRAGTVRFLAVALMTTLMAALAAADNDAPEPRVIKRAAEDMAKEFYKDTDAAVKKYLPPRKGAEGGVLVEITGVVGKVDEKAREVGLEAGPNAIVILHPKKFEGIKAGDKVTAQGTFRTYFMRTIVIDCDEVKAVAK